MQNTVLQDLIENVLAPNTVTQMLSVKAVSSAVTTHTGGGPGNGECQKHIGYSGYYQCLHTYLDVNDAIQELPDQRYKSSEQHKGKHTARIVCDTKEVEIFAAFLKCRDRFTNSPHLRHTDTGQINGDRRAYLF